MIDHTDDEPITGGEAITFIAKLVFCRPALPSTAEELERRTDRFVEILDRLGCTVCIRGLVRIKDAKNIELHSWSIRWREDPWNDLGSVTSRCVSG